MNSFCRLFAQYGKRRPVKTVLSRSTIAKVNVTRVITDGPHLSSPGATDPDGATPTVRHALSTAAVYLPADNLRAAAARVTIPYDLPMRGRLSVCQSAPNEPLLSQSV